MSSVQFQTVLADASLEQFIRDAARVLDGVEFLDWEPAPFSASLDLYSTGVSRYCRATSTGRLRSSIQLGEQQLTIWLARNGHQRLQQARSTAPSPVLPQPLVCAGPTCLPVELSNLSGLGVCLKRGRIFEEARKQGIVPPSTLPNHAARFTGPLLLRQLLLEIEDCLDSCRSERTILLLHQALITVLIHHWMGVESSPGGSAQMLHQAIDWLQAHLTEPIRWGQLCQALGITQRSLQLAFERELQTTPTRWLKQQRLELLHQRLQSPDADELAQDGIISLVEGCGLPYSSSTLGAYRSLYHETPSQTLRYRSGLSTRRAGNNRNP